MYADDTPTPPSLLEKVRSLTNDPAWRLFYHRYTDLVFRFARSCGLSDYDAEDIAHDTMLALTKLMPDFEYDPARCRFRTFVQRLARGRIVDRWRREETARQGLAALAETHRQQAVEAECDHRWQTEWERFVVTRALDQLSKHRRLQPSVKTVLIELYVRGRSNAETAQRLEATVQDIHRIRSRWRKPLAEAVAQVRREID